MGKSDFSNSKIDVHNSREVEIGNVKENDKLGEKIVYEVARFPGYLKILIVAGLVTVCCFYFYSRTLT